MKKLIPLTVFISLAYIISYYASDHIKRNHGAAVPKKIERIISASLSSTEILVELGQCDRIVGVSLSGSNPEIVKDKPKVGRGYGNLNIESILALRPDIVFANSGDCSPLRDMGIYVYSINTCAMEDVIALVRGIGRLVGTEREAEIIARNMETAIREAKSKANSIICKPSIYFEASGIGKTRGPGSLTHDLIAMAGGENIARDQMGPFPLLSSEYIIARNPYVIIIEEYGASISEIKQRNGWQKIDAIKNNRVFISPTHFTGYTPRCVEGLRHFAKWFHPEVFRE